jgi:hypothetical protein
MIRRFARGGTQLRVETRRDKTSGEFVLILHQEDGTQLIDRFSTRSKLRKRLEAIERRLTSRRWAGHKSLPAD